jgi:hypothetical protein
MENDNTMNEDKEKLENGIKIAKDILQENPNDTWVEKFLVEMEKELERLENLSDDRRTDIR